MLKDCTIDQVLRKAGFDGSRVRPIGAGLYNDSYIIDSDRGRISAILDFDRGLYGDPELEFAVLDTYGSSTPDFFEGYAKSRPVDADAQIRQRLYMVYELIKYAFIRVARGKSMSTGRSHVAQCKRILKELE